MDCLITTLSLINPYRFREQNYQYPWRKRDENGTITYETVTDRFIAGRFTNEAPAKYLINRKLNETYTLFDKVIILGTKECHDEKIGDLFKKALEESKDNATTALIKNKENASAFLDMTTLDYYKHVILRHIEESDAGELRQIFAEKDARDDIFLFLDVDDLESGDILMQIQKALDDDADADIYLDYTGGTRVSSLIAMMLCRWLEVNNYNLRCAVYSDINNKANVIRDITDIYGMFNAIIAHDNVYNPDLAQRRYENQNESVKYGLTEYRKEKKAKLTDHTPPEAPKDNFIFVSYSHMDSSPAKAIIQRLQTEGYRIWYDAGIPWGADWEKSLNDNMNQCNMAIVLLSQNYLDSEYCIKELDILTSKPKYTIWLKGLDIPADDKEKYPFLTKDQGIEYQKYDLREFNEKMLGNLEHLPEACAARNSK